MGGLLLYCTYRMLYPGGTVLHQPVLSVLFSILFGFISHLSDTTVSQDRRVAFPKPMGKEVPAKLL